MSSASTTRAAVLDLGSNSFHVLVADVEGPHVDTVTRAREMLHLGRTLARTGGLDADTIERATATVDRHLRLARRHGAEEIVVVATAALREPASAPLVDRLTALLGRAPTVLHGHEEARLSYLGARAATGDGDAPTLVLDLGGGSLEVAVGTGARIGVSASARLGASRLAALAEDDPPSADEVRALTEGIDAELAAVLPGLEHRRAERVVAVGGTVRAFARHLAALAGRWLPASVNLAPLHIDELVEATERLLVLTTEERARLPGVTGRRADHLHVAGLVLARTLRALDVDLADVSDWGLREGVLLDRFGDVSAVPSTERRAHEVTRLLRASRLDERPGRRLARLAERLDRAIDGDPPGATTGAEDERRTLLDAAARLRDVGSALPLRRPHEHGAYVIEQAELRGFSPRELALVLTVVRFLPSRGTSRRYAPYAGLDADDRLLAQRLLAVLRLAVALDADGQSEVVAARRTGEVIEVTLRAPAPTLDRVARDVADIGRSLAADLGLGVALHTAPGL
jgi:exopolyphosphatase/guanosine-5'-triphosphate,3'-diphosphate pyrophosphatase